MDQFLNIKLDDISVVEELKYPHLVGFSWLIAGPERRVVRRVLHNEAKDCRADMGGGCRESKLTFQA